MKVDFEEGFGYTKKYWYIWLGTFIVAFGLFSLMSQGRSMGSAVFVALALTFGIWATALDAFDPVLQAKNKADIALHNQKARLAESHRPLEVAGQIAIIEATEQVKTEMLIKLKQNEKEIELALAVGNADKVLDFTRKRFQLKKELEQLDRG